MIDPLILEARRVRLLEQLRELRRGVTELAEGYGALQTSGLLIDTDGIGALTTPAYCVAGAREVFEETTIELDAAVDALDRAAMYTTRLRSVVLD
ncbi:hypothetical protein [Nocardia sp. NPDC050175]|uniref:hypothetical protein n=1 Tax=Nocardia sp. NPDC050175 TaxID=3364317 RepID=UPI0037B3FDD3